MVGEFLQDLQQLFSNISSPFAYGLGLKSNFLFSLLDIVIVALLFYWLYILIQGTKAIRILLGIVVLVVVMMISRILGFITLNWLLRYLVTMLIIAIPIVFQPELRRALEKIGRTGFLGSLSSPEEKLEHIVDEVVKACRVMCKNKIGALLVFRRKTGLDEYVDTGTKIDGRLSSELILNIFFPSSPLHDGAIIIDGDRILSAGSMLPLSEEGKLSFNFGTRHRAALGLSLETDAVVIVISEEKGTISLAWEGKITQNLNIQKLQKILLKLLKPEQKKVGRFSFKKKR
jgi:diadenylate cyclase